MTNPIVIPKEYQSLIDSGKVKNQVDLSKKFKVSRLRISQFLKGLKLSFSQIKKIEAFGDHHDQSLSNGEISQS